MSLNFCGSCIYPGQMPKKTGMKLKFDLNKQAITNVKYTTEPNYRAAGITLPYVLRKLSLLKSKIDVANNSFQHEDICNSELWTYLGTLIFHIAFFRTEYDRLLNPKKPRHHKYLGNKLVNKYSSILNAHNLSFSNHLYEIQKRIEHLIGFELIWCIRNKTFYPAKFFTKIISSYNKKVIYLSVLTNTLDDVAVKYNNKWYDKRCMIQVFNDIGNNHAEHSLIPAFENKRIKTCPVCKNKWTPSSQFLYCKQTDSKVCLSCSIQYSKYKQPVFDLNNVYNDSYHGSFRGLWKWCVCRRSNEQSLPLGMELETEFRTATLAKSKNELVHDLWVALGKKDIFFERDGSLNSAGVECITNPMTPEYAREYWKDAWKVLEQNTNGILSGTSGYAQAHPTAYWGIHLTFDRKHWTDLALAKFNNFLYNPNNKAFIQAIAQRTKHFGAGDVGDVRGANYKPNKQFDFDKHAGPGRKVSGSERTTVNMGKVNLIEIRMFQAVNNKIDLLKNYDFINALWDWTMNHKVSFTPTVDDFLAWLFEPKQVERHKKYKYLVKYLQQDVFHIRYNNIDTIRLVPNTWKDKAHVVKFHPSVVF